MKDVEFVSDEILNRIKLLSDDEGGKKQSVEKYDEDVESVLSFDEDR